MYNYLDIVFHVCNFSKYVYETRNVCMFKFAPGNKFHHILYLLQCLFLKKFNTPCLNRDFIAWQTGAILKDKWSLLFTLSSSWMFFYRSAVESNHLLDIRKHSLFEIGEGISETKYDSYQEYLKHCTIQEEHLKCINEFLKKVLTMSPDIIQSFVLESTPYQKAILKKEKDVVISLEDMREFVNSNYCDKRVISSQTMLTH